MVDISQLNPDIKTFLDKLGDATIDESASLDIAKGREDYLMFALTNAGWPLTMPCVRDLLIPSADLSYQIPIRIYTPILDKKLPALIYYHGGGWQRGDIATHDSICRHFARLAECIVVSVQWRLAPEHRFPIGSDDCFNVMHGLLSMVSDIILTCVVSPLVGIVPVAIWLLLHCSVFGTLS
jgi:acetyl esterase